MGSISSSYCLQHYEHGRGSLVVMVTNSWSEKESALDSCPGVTEDVPYRKGRCLWNLSRIHVLPLVGCGIILCSATLLELSLAQH
ncbi:hypothetical protein TNCV_17431 [Trichonephila clavipes]|nr:hypothetical protein TNCV_17431 [Trichonephila clavipes]